MVRSLSIVLVLSIFAFALLGISRAVYAQDDAQLYGKSVVLPTDASDALGQTAAELTLWLGEITGQEFGIARGDGESGIRLRIAAAGDSRFERRGGEAFHIFSRADHGALTITGNSEQALSHGVYWYLDQLGCRWLLPGDNWTIIPQRDSIRIEIDKLVEPAFRLRNFFGTGGFGGSLPVDPGMDLEARWDLWKNRNRFGGDIQFAGHAGEAFNLAHKEILEAHPEYRAEVGGERQPPGVVTKLCTSNEALRELFIEDRLGSLAQSIERFPDSPRSMSVSVEPADGGGHCECAQCLKLGAGSVSDRVFTMANAVAAVVAREYPGKFANLYAYNEHAAPPGFRVEPNIFVLVAPYAFQRTGLPGDDLVKAWSSLVPNLGIYDYWSIPDWANCLPGFDYSTEVAQKIRFWRGQGVSAFLGESSYSAGNVGLAWYLAGRMMWDPTIDEQAVIDEFFELAFGVSQSPMRRMMERWASGFLLTEHELALSYRDLDEALSLAENALEAARIRDFVRYVEYLRLWRDYQETAGDSPERIRRADEVVRHVWRIYPSAMVHGFRMYQLIARSNPQLLELWPQKNAAAAAWKNLSPVSDEELARLVAAGVERFAPLDFEPKTFSGTLEPMHRPASLSEERVRTPYFAGDHDFEFWAPPGVASITLGLQCRSRENYPGNLVIVSDPDGEEVFRHTAPADGEWHDLVIPTPRTGNYRMRVHDQKIFFAFQVPRNLPFVVKGWRACPELPSKVYFHVPFGLRRLAIAQESAVPLKVTDSQGHPVASSGEKLFVVDVPADQSGTIWQISDFKSYQPLRLLNAANVFAFSEQGLMKPVE